MSSTADATKTAEGLLNAARKANPDSTEGIVRHKRPAGDVLVTWKRRARLYDVGTESSSIIYGRRSEVLPRLVEMIANPDTSYEPTPRAGGSSSSSEAHARKG